MEDQSLPRDSPEDLSNAADKIAENGVAIKSSHSSASDLQVLRSLTEGDADSGGQTKSGTRFSRESLRILRGWLTSHYRLPYPTDEDKETLQKQTGLSKTQISNWIANARRRGKVRAPRTVSPGPKSLSSPIDIPRRGTPIPRDMTKMNPLERWENSPPEHEAASVTAIANAVSSSRLLSGHGSPELDYDNGDSDSVAARSCNRSSTSGFGTSGSSGDSFASAFSYDSKNSFGPLAARGRRRRGQRRQITKPTLQNIAAPATPRKFQCTFCTESFKTKHDWQRHEKSLHLSLERWICAANGPTILSPETNTPVCAFCGVSNPDEAHLEFHVSALIPNSIFVSGKHASEFPTNSKFISESIEATHYDISTVSFLVVYVYEMRKLTYYHCRTSGIVLKGLLRSEHSTGRTICDSIYFLSTTQSSTAGRWMHGKLRLRL